MPETSRMELEALLAFHANGTLEADDRAEVDAALSSDADLRTELAFLRAVRDGVREVSDASPGELGLRRLLRDVRREKRRTAVRQIARPLLAVAAAILIVVQSGAILTLLDRPDGGDSELLAGAEVGALQVTFAPDATAAQIQELLLAADARIVSGPSGMGIYRLATEDPEQALATLRAQPAVVTFVDRE